MPQWTQASTDTMQALIRDVYTGTFQYTLILALLSHVEALYGLHNIHDESHAKHSRLHAWPIFKDQDLY